MKRLLAPLLTGLLLAVSSPAAEDWNQIEPLAQSIARLNVLSRGLAAGIQQQVRERGVSSEDSREQIALATACSLDRAVSCLKQRFFDGAEQDEIEERIVKAEALAERVRNAGAKIGLYGFLRERLAAFLNEKDWLKRQLGMR